MMRNSILCAVLLLHTAVSSFAFVPSTTTNGGHRHGHLHMLGGFLDQMTKGTTTSKTPKVQAPADFVLPEPQPLTVTEKTDVGKLVASSAALAVRLATTAFVLGWKIDDIFHDGEGYCLQLGPLRIRDSSSVLATAPRPTSASSLVLYGYDASPYTKRVRETLNLLDLSYEYRPTPGARQGKFSQELLQKTGRQTVPSLMDRDTGTQLFESSDIIEHLVTTYGPSPETFDRKALWPITTESFSVTTSTIAAVLLGMPGAQRQANARPDNEDMTPIQVWGYECSPFCRPVLEKLCGLCLPHNVISCSRGSVNRDRLVAKTGTRFQVPYLVDPNTGVEMFESAEIVEYLEQVYTV